MSSHTLEVVYIPLKPGTDLTAGSAKEIWTSTLSTIHSQKGCKALYQGLQIEHPNIVQMIVVWDSLASHEAFMKSETYGPFFQKVLEVIEGAPSLFHISFPAGADAMKPLNAKVTECISLFFPPSHPNEAFESNWSKFVETAGKIENNGIVATIGGWSVEEQKHKNLAEEGQEEGKAKLFGAFLGWPSVERHMEFRAREEFVGLVPFIRDGPKGSAMWHVAFEKFEV